MMNERLSAFLPRIHALPGEIGIYIEDLATGEVFSHQADLPLVAASVIKLPILVEAFAQAEAGEVSMDEVFSVLPEHKMPSCGALSYMHDGVTVTLRDLCVLMIILSDNTATNLLMDRLGMDRVNAAMRSLGLTQTTLRRRLFDADAAARGLENTITARDMACLLKKLYVRQCVSAQADAQMLSILCNQRLNGKIPFYLHDYPIAHKTGEDDGITHDVGIVFSAHDYLLCFTSEHTFVPGFERIIQDMSRTAVIEMQN